MKMKIITMAGRSPLITPNKGLKTPSLGCGIYRLAIIRFTVLSNLGESNVS
jgi:hypothetical protein